MAEFTSLGAGIWEWRRWRNLDPVARLLWLGLYTSLQAKRLVPGLWHGSIALMVEATGLLPEQCIRGVDILIENDLVEYDIDTRVLRMIELPDTGEFPTNPSWVKGWWNRFVTVPQCPIRDAHVKTLRWILEEGARHRGKLLSQPMEQAWLETFGNVEVPVMRKRGVVRLEGDSDTSTSVQPSLFTAPWKASEAAGHSVAERADARSMPSSGISSSDPLRKQENKLLAPTPEFGGHSVDTRVDTPGHKQDQEQEQEKDLSSGGSGGISTGGGDRPKLTLVPGHGPFTVDEVHALFAGAPYWPRMLTEDAQNALGHAIASLADLAREHDVFALLRGRIERRMGEISRAGPMWLAAPGRLTALVQEAIAHQRDSAAKSAALREVLGKGALET